MDPFTYHARQAFKYADSIADGLNNNYIGSEHLLLGSLAAMDELGIKGLTPLSLARINYDNVYNEVVKITEPNPNHCSYNEKIFTPRAKRVIELAFEHARQQNHERVDANGFIAGTLKEGAGVGYRAIQNLTTPESLAVLYNSYWSCEKVESKPTFEVEDSFVRDVNILAKQITVWNMYQGFWTNTDQDLTLQERATRLALIHSEVSEVLEAIRTDAQDDKIPYLKGEVAEMADVIIRCLDYCGRYGINIGEAVRDKMRYNQTRPKMHGKKF